ncbi:hypothetical protein QQG55_31780 [Brugia pahangi]
MVRYVRFIYCSVIIIQYTTLLDDNVISKFTLHLFKSEGFIDEWAVTFYEIVVRRKKRKDDLSTYPQQCVPLSICIRQEQLFNGKKLLVCGVDSSTSSIHPPVQHRALQLPQLPLPEELDYGGEIPNCRDGGKPLLAADIGIHTCDKNCPEGFRCEYKTANDTTRKGICCPNLKELEKIYNEDEKLDRTIKN